MTRWGPPSETACAASAQACVNRADENGHRPTPGIDRAHAHSARGVGSSGAHMPVAGMAQRKGEKEVGPAREVVGPRINQFSPWRRYIPFLLFFLFLFSVLLLNQKIKLYLNSNFNL